MGLSVEMKNLKLKFNEAMKDIYKQAKIECGYNATRFLQMVNELGGYKAALRLLYSKDVSEGFIELWKLARLDLTMEAMIYENLIWHDLFNKKELAIARKRLEDLDYKPKIKTNF